MCVREKPYYLKLKLTVAFSICKRGGLIRMRRAKHLYAILFLFGGGKKEG